MSWSDDLNALVGPVKTFQTERAQEYGPCLNFLHFLHHSDKMPDSVMSCFDKERTKYHDDWQGMMMDFVDEHDLFYDCVDLQVLPASIQQTVENLIWLVNSQLYVPTELDSELDKIEAPSELEPLVVRFFDAVNRARVDEARDIMNQMHDMIRLEYVKGLGLEHLLVTNIKSASKC